MVDCNLRNLANIVVLELVNVVHDLALISSNGSEHHEVLQVLVVGER